MQKIAKIGLAYTAVNNEERDRTETVVENRENTKENKGKRERKGNRLRVKPKTPTSIPKKSSRRCYLLLFAGEVFPIFMLHLIVKLRQRSAAVAEVETGGGGGGRVSGGVLKEVVEVHIDPFSGSLLAGYR